MHLVDGLRSGLGLGGGCEIAGVEKAIAAAIRSCKESLNGGGNVMLVLDGVDFFLAATGCEVLEILDMIGELRDVRTPSLQIQPTCICLLGVLRNSKFTPPSLPQLPIFPPLNRPLHLSKRPTQLS